MELETLKVCIDGIDCSGKTTLWNKLHKISDYRWKLEDRSFLTMVVYAMLHNRKKKFDYRRQLMNDVANLNHKYIVIHPTWEVIESRYKVRGDDLHDLETMKKIHRLYGEEIDNIKNFPNVLVLSGTSSPEDDANRVHSWLLSQEDIGLIGLTDMIQVHVGGSKDREVSPLRFSFIESGNFPEDEPRILDHDFVKSYYPKVKPATVVEFNKMMSEFMETIDNELAGRNMYGTPQGISSRRFIFNQEACVSFMQAMVRDGIMYFHVMCRSSHVLDVFPADLQLIYHMCRRAHEKLGLPKDMQVIFNFTLNSAHTVA